MSAGVGNVLTTIAGCTGVGAFIDFYIGKDGQKRVKDWLETWWYRLSDIPVRAVGREEALNALRVIDYLFGPKLFSSKRLRSAFILKILALLIYPGIFAISAIHSGMSVLKPPYAALVYLIILDIFVISLSVSVSKVIIRAGANLLGHHYLINAVLIVMLLSVQGIVLLYFSELAAIVTMFALSIIILIVMLEELPSNTMLHFEWLTSKFAPVFDESIGSMQRAWSADLSALLFIHRPADRIVHLYSQFTTNPFKIYQHGSALFDITPNGWAVYSINFGALLMNAGRLFLALLFFGSYLLVPIWPRILTLYARVIESDKPVFTVVGAGIGGFASAVSALLK